MNCKGCGSKTAVRIRITMTSETCDECGGLGNLSYPDVYFRKPYMDPNLPHPDRPHEKNGVWVRSRQHKAAIMKEQNLREAGDRRHGGRL